MCEVYIVMLTSQSSAVLTVAIQRHAYSYASSETSAM